MFDGGRRNITNMMWMKIIDESLIHSIPVEDLGESALKTIHRF
jgi:hypothetical protein